MKLDLGKINFANGNLVEATASDCLSTTMKAFVIGSVGSTEDAIFNLKRFSQSNQETTAEIKILLAAHLTCLGVRQEAIRIINSLGKITDSSFSGELREYFVSTISFLMKVLSQENFDIDNIDNRVSIIGDSHVLGISGACKSRQKLAFCYVPGITFRSLASPFNNLKKQGLYNAISLSQGAKTLILSIGEIEMREAFDKPQSSELKLKYLLSNFSQFLDFFNTFRVQNQNVLLIEPPLPKTIPRSYKRKESTLYQRFLENLVEICNNAGICVIRYAEPISGTTLVAERPDFFVDHAHYKNELYFKLLLESVETYG